MWSLRDVGGERIVISLSSSRNPSINKNKAVKTKHCSSRSSASATATQKVLKRIKTSGNQKKAQNSKTQLETQHGGARFQSTNLIE